MKLSSLALVGALALSTAGASLAQPAPPPGLGADGGHRQWQRPDPAKMVEERTEHLRTVLQLRPDQEPALRALAAALTPDPAKMEQRRADRAEARNLTTPQRLDRMQARMTERQAAFAKRSGAIKRFYAQLSPTQQKAFDALHQDHGGMGGMRGHGPGGRGHGMGPGFG